MNLFVLRSVDTSCEELQKDILSICTERHDISVDSKNFLKLFKIHDSNRKILTCANKEVQRFRELKKQFDEVKGGFTGKDLVDLHFEFQVRSMQEYSFGRNSVLSFNKCLFCY